MPACPTSVLAAADGFEGCHEIVGQRGREPERFSRRRVGKGQAVGVEEVAGEKPATLAVDGVAEDGVAEPGQVDPGLVGAPCVEPQFQQAVPSRPLKQTVPGAAVPAIGGYGHAGTAAGITPDGDIDDAGLPGWRTFNQCQIAFLDEPILI